MIPSGKESIKKNGTDHGYSFMNSNLAIERLTFDPLEKQNSRTHTKLYASASHVPPNYVRMLNNILFRGLATKK